MKYTDEEKFEAQLERAAIDLENERIRARYAKLVPNPSAKQLPEKSNSNGPWLLIALFIMAIASWFMFNLNDSEQNTVQQYVDNMSFYSDPYTQNRSIEKQSEFAMIKQAANKGDYTYALSLLESTQLTGISKADSLFLIQLYLKTNAPEKASLLVKEMQLATGHLVEELDWISALTFLSNGENNQAKQILNEIINNKQYKWQEAEKLIRTIE